MERETFAKADGNACRQHGLQQAGMPWCLHFGIRQPKKNVPNVKCMAHAWSSSFHAIADDVVHLVQQFYNSAELPQGINSTYIALIPKTNAAHTPHQFRPISLCNVIYKIITKSLAERIKLHLPNYIHSSQSAFIPGRHITSNIIVAQEIVHSFSLATWNKKTFMLKIDLAKAFDRIEWNFIINALKQRGFNDHFTNLIQACITAPVFSILVNSQPSNYFTSQRGIRQGCPLSPYLFVLAINDLSKRLQVAMVEGNIQGIFLGPSCPPIHSLLFADDLLICGQVNDYEPQTLRIIIQNFATYLVKHQIGVSLLFISVKTVPFMTDKRFRTFSLFKR